MKTARMIVTCERDNDRARSAKHADRHMQIPIYACVVMPIQHFCPVINPFLSFVFGSFSFAWNDENRQQTMISRARNQFL